MKNTLQLPIFKEPLSTPKKKRMSHHSSTKSGVRKNIHIKNDNYNLLCRHADNLSIKYGKTVSDSQIVNEALAILFDKINISK